jgi:hypothetical protein
MSNKKISEMTGNEVVAMLNSGKFLSDSIRTELQSKLEFMRKTGMYKDIDYFFATLAAKNKPTDKKSDKKKKEAIPAITPVIPKQQNVLDYSKIAGNKLNSSGSSLKSSTNSSVDESIESTIKELFVNDKMVLSFKEIYSLYKRFALHRVKIHYLNLKRKLSILDRISILNSESTFKHLFEYDKLLKEKNLMAECIKIHSFSSCFNQCLNIIMEFFMMYKSDPKKISNKMNHVDNLVNSAGSLYAQLGELDESFENQFSKYKSNYLNIIDFIQQMISLMMNLESLDPSSANKYPQNISKIIHQTNSFLENIVNDTDPHIHCEYYVNLQNYDKSRKQSMIQPIGISLHEYYNFMNDFELDTIPTDDFDISLNGNPHYSDLYLSQMTYVDINKLFNYQFQMPGKYDFIRIMLINPSGTGSNIRKMSINYIIKEKIPYAKCYLKLNDVPDNARILSSIIRNPELDEPIDIIVMANCANAESDGIEILG